MSDGISDRDRDRADRRYKRIGRCTEHGLYDAVSRSGGTLLGLSVKYGEVDCLITLRALMPAGRMVAFVGAETFGGAILKASKAGNSDELRWREDRYART